MYQVSTSMQGDALGPGVKVVVDIGEQDIMPQTHHYQQTQKETSFNQWWAFREEGKRDAFQDVRKEKRNSIAEYSKGII